MCSFWHVNYAHQHYLDHLWHIRLSDFLSHSGKINSGQNFWFTSEHVRLLTLWCHFTCRVRGTQLASLCLPMIRFVGQSIRSLQKKHTRMTKTRKTTTVRYSQAKWLQRDAKGSKQQQWHRLNVKRHKTPTNQWKSNTKIQYDNKKQNEETQRDATK